MLRNAIFRALRRRRGGTPGDEGDWTGYEEPEVCGGDEPLRLDPGSMVLPGARLRDPDRAWAGLPLAPLDPAHLVRNRVITHEKSDPAHVPFDLLRTRLMHLLRSRGWTRVGITSPTKGCGKTFVSANLALSLARRSSSRVVLVDLDLRLPRLARMLGVERPARLRDFLAGETAMAEQIVRGQPNLALCLNAQKEPDASELMQDPKTGATLAHMRAALQPDVVLYDLPPMLATDDVVGFLPEIDGMLLVAGGGMTQGSDIEECERLLGQQTPLIGVILNRAEDASAARYYS